MSADIIAPFFRPLEPLLHDPEISEIMIVGGDCIYVERDGQLERVADVQMDDRALAAGAKLLLRSVGKELTIEAPLQDGRFADGSRVAVALPPCALSGLTMTVRKFGSRRYSAEQLVERGMLSTAMLDALLAAMGRRDTILVSGGTSAGKTTVLNALAQTLPAEERIIIIEETAEIYLAKPHLVRFEARPAQDTLPAVTIRDLLRASLRHRPDRLIVGEVRGGEAWDLLQCLNTGHSGSLSTIHANSARAAIHRLISCVLQAGEPLPHEAICAQIADTIRYILHLERHAGVRQARELVRVRGYDFATRTWDMETVCTDEKREEVQHGRGTMSASRSEAWTRP